MNPLVSLLIKRLSMGVVTLLVISMLIFVGVEALPGDLAEAILGQNALPETVTAFRKELKLDLPPHIRYFAWLGDFVQGDFGNSLANGRPIADLIGWRFSNTLFLAAMAAAIAVPLAVGLGILAALFIVHTIGYLAPSPTPPPTAPSAPVPPQEAVAPAPPMPYTLQVAAYLKPEHAERYLKDLKANGIEAYLKQAQANDKTWYQVRIAHFPTKAEALAYGSGLKARGLVEDFYVAKDPPS